MAIDKQAFEDCFKQWLSYKPNKRKDWPALKGIYYQELSRFSEVQLREALGRMLTKNNYFPDIAEITAEIRSVKSVDDVAGTLSKSELERAIYDHVLKADRYLDSILGPEFHGHQIVAEEPEGIPRWMDKMVRHAIKVFHGTDRQNYMRGTLLKWVTDHVSKNGVAAS